MVELLSITNMGLLHTSFPRRQAEVGVALA